MKETSIPEMENGEIFDQILEDVITNKEEYTIYEDLSYTKPLVVMKPYE